MSEPLMPDEDVLCAYLDGECTDAERAWVDEQLAASAEARAVLDDLASARAAVRALPPRDAPAEFWARVLDPQAGTVAEDELTARRRRRASMRPARWLVAASAAAVAAVLAVVVLVPEPQTVTPPVGVFADAHALRSSLQDDATSTLAPLAVAAGFRR